MAFDLHGDIILTRDVTEHGLRAGDVGTVVERHATPDVFEEGYSVEFFDMTGNTVAVIPLPASALRLPRRIQLQSNAGTAKHIAQVRWYAKRPVKPLCGARHLPRPARNLLQLSRTWP